MNNNLLHAQHNSDLCDLLIKNGKYNDWVITSAFYSAMHFVYGKIFPITTDKVYNSFTEYYISLQRSSILEKKNKHTCTVGLVSVYLPKVYPQYKWLLDTSMTARYKNYNVSNALAKTAQDYLIEIKTQCLEVAKTIK